MLTLLGAGDWTAVPLEGTSTSSGSGVLGLDPSGWVGYMEYVCVYIVPGWNGLLSNGPNTETAFPFQQGLELCTLSSNF